MHTGITVRAAYNTAPAQKRAVSQIRLRNLKHNKDGQELNASDLISKSI